MNCDSAVHLVADIFAFIHKDPPTLAAPSEIAPVLEQTIADKRIDRDMTETNEINRKQPETRVLYEADGICSTYITTDTPATFDPPSGEFSFVGCRNGQLRLSTGDGAELVRRNDIVLVGPRNTACRFELDAGAEVFCLAIRTDTIGTMVRIDRKLMQVGLKLHAGHVIHLHNCDMQLMDAYGRILDLKFGNRHHFSHETIRNIIGAVVYDFLAAALDCAGRSETGPALYSSADKLFFRFVEMLNEGEPVSRKVGHYADRLCITPKYLSTVCHHVAGRTATDIINQKIREQIRHYLEHTDQPIKDIALRLDFPNIQFFGKYVRRQLGCSPKAYRAAMGRTAD